MCVQRNSREDKHPKFSQVNFGAFETFVKAGELCFSRAHCCHRASSHHPFLLHNPPSFHTRCGRTHEKRLCFLRHIFSPRHSFHSSIRPNYVGFCLACLGCAAEIRSVSGMTLSLVAKALVPTHVPEPLTLRQRFNWGALSGLRTGEREFSSLGERTFTPQICESSSEEPWVRHGIGQLKGKAAAERF